MLGINTNSWRSETYTCCHITTLFAHLNPPMRRMYLEYTEYKYETGTAICYHRNPQYYCHKPYRIRLFLVTEFNNSQSEYCIQLDDFGLGARTRTRQFYDRMYCTKAPIFFRLKQKDNINHICIFQSRWFCTVEPGVLKSSGL